jgi:positive regulator of sigma E activity
MILHPAIIALVASSVLISSLVLYAVWYGVRILHSWDLRSGSSLQLDLERRTYLISTVLAYVFGFQLVSLFLLIYTADSLSTLFTGAMCAAGTFNVNFYGYPLLVVKIVNFLLAGLWLTVNYADNRAYDYPLIRKKYAFLLFLAPYLVLETVLQVRYFLGMSPDVITSCCGSLFSVNASGVASDLAALPAVPLQYAFTASMAATVVLGIIVVVTRRGGCAFSFVAGAAFIIGIASLISFISPAIYELPTHHCPFCVLQKEYGYIGYIFYATLLGGAVTGIGVGVLGPFRSVPSLVDIIPSLQRRLAVLSVLFYTSAGLLTLITIVRSNLK